MAITKALEFDQTPNKLLFQIAEDARAQQLADQKLKLDEQRKRQELLGMLNSDVLSKDYEKEVVSRNLRATQEAAANYIKQNPDGPLTDLRMFINSQTGKTAEQSARVKTYKDNVDKYVAAVGKDSIYEPERLRAMLYDKGLFKVDQTGFKNLKPTEEINEDVQSYVDEILANEPDMVVSLAAANKELDTHIKDASLYEESTTREIETPDGKRTTVTGVTSKVPYYLEVKKRNVKQPTGMVEQSYLDVKKGSNGLIDEDVFRQIYSDPRRAVAINAGAVDTMKQGNVARTPENMEIYKRTFLTNYLDRNKKGSIDIVDKTLYTTPSTVVNVGTSGPGVEQGRIPGYKNLLTQLKAGEDPMKSTKVDSNIKNALLTIADENSVFRTTGKKVSPSMIKVKLAQDGSVAIYSAATGDLIASLSEQSFDQRVNDVAGGKFVAQATVEGNPSPVGSGINWKK
jgi:hypothetical protein